MRQVAYVVHNAMTENEHRIFLFLEPRVFPCSTTLIPFSALAKSFNIPKTPSVVTFQFEQIRASLIPDSLAYGYP